MTKSRKTLTVFALSGASIAAWVGGTSLIENVQFARAEQQVNTSKSQLKSVQDLSSVFRTIGTAVEPSVVEIRVLKTIKGARQTMPDDDFFKRFFHDQIPGMPQTPDQGTPPGDHGNQGSGDLQEIGTGSGVIMEVDGDTAYILTNNHVAGGASKLTVTLNDGRVIKNAKVLGTDPKSDLAVVRIKADHLIAATWGDSSKLQRGDWVLAFGAPFGYVGSMTHGIVSALNRTSVGILGKYGYEDFIQVDAPINPGNSGGPLVNIHGDVVGINTAIASRSGAFSGIGFAIPVSEAHHIYNELKSKGKVTRGWLGVSIADVQRFPSLAKSFGFNKDQGVIVEQVLNGTPAAGKLKDGDIIVAVNGKPVNDVVHLRNEVAEISPGDMTHMSVFRDGKDIHVTIKMGQQPTNMAEVATGPGSNQSQGGNSQNAQALGMTLSDVTDELADKFSLGSNHQGALVTHVDRNSLAAEAGVQPGDLITKVGSESVSNAQDASEAVTKANVKKGIRLYVTNREGSQFVFIQKDSGQ